MTRQVVGNHGNWKDRVLRVFHLRCEGASELASIEQDEPLGFPEQLALRGHLLACASCRRFRHQLGVLREASRQLAARRDKNELGAEELSAEARERIARALKNAQNGGDSSSESGKD